MLHQLTPELVALILDKLIEGEPGDRPAPRRLNLSSYATISRTWQWAVEARTFAHIRARNDPGYIDKFRANLAGRRHLVRAVSIKIFLPTEGCSRQNYAQDHEVFASTIDIFMNELHQWERDGDGSGASSLGLSIFVDSKGRPGRGSSLAKYRFPTLTEEEASRLPTLRRVTSLRTYTTHRAMHPRAVFMLAAAMPYLEELAIRHYDPRQHDKNREARLDHRAAFVSGISNLRARGNLRRLQIAYEAQSLPTNHDFNEQSFEDEQGVDPFSEEIRLLSQGPKFEELELDHIPISLDLFYNTRKSDFAPATQTEEAIWENLRKFDIILTMRDAGGRWYFTGTRPDDEDGWVSSGSEYIEDSEFEGSEPETRPRQLAVDEENPYCAWRTLLNPETLNPLFTHLSGALGRMPKLTSGYIQAVPLHGEDIYLQLSEGDRSFEFVYDHDTTWVPPPEVMDMLERAGWGAKNSQLERMPVE
ncbi:unnamed protein product [Clonostachys byssicola]|uniref:F-box domain-containing protein n=1 Tax=Clonostachys byssicola TaxID=160290 RepID=A0A9N9Y4P6_9HYPO|nr:unnamed protein product [Clonostachys byssicola]